MAPQKEHLSAATVTQTAAAGETCPVEVPDSDAGALKERDHRRYEYIDEHGRGGSGRVMRTRDVYLGREVAIKESLEAGGAREARFIREAMITARLEHPGIVPVHDAGRWPDGTPFYAMKMVNGRPLKDLIGEGQTLEARLALVPTVIAVADAIAYAHDRGIIHRDLKPSNVVVGTYGEVVVIDWGLAKDLINAEKTPDHLGPYRVCETPGITVVGAVLGTPAYMPPEQAKGKDVDERADIYSLGAILYHVLAGRPPYVGAKSGDILALIAHGPPEPLHRLVTGIPKDLAAIVEKAMAAVPRDRYESSAALVADLRAFVSGQLVSARAYSTASLAGRWLRRHRLLVGISSACFLALICAVSLSAVRVLRARAVAEDRAASLYTSNRRLEDREQSLIIANARQSLGRDPARSLIQLSEYPLLGTHWNTVRALALQALAYSPPDIVLASQAPAAIAFDAQAARLAVSDQTGLTVWDLSSSTPIWRHNYGFTSEAVPTGLLWLRTGALVASRTSGTIFIGYPEQPKRPGQTLRPGHRAVLDIAVSDDNDKLVAGCLDGSVWLYDFADNAATVVGQHDGAAWAVASIPSGFLSIGEDGYLRRWSSRAEGSSGSTKISSSVLLSLAYSSALNIAFVGTRDGELVLVDVGTMRPIERKHYSKREPINQVALTGSLVIASTGDGHLLVYDLQTRELQETAGGNVIAAAGGYVGIGDDDGSLTLLEPMLTWRRRVPSSSSLVNWIALTPELDAMATASRDGFVRVWRHRRLPRKVVSIGTPLTALLVAPDSESQVIVVDDLGTLHLLGGSLESLAMARSGIVRPVVTPGEAFFVISDLNTGRMQAWDYSLHQLASMTLSGEILKPAIGGMRVVTATADGRGYEWRPLDDESMPSFSLPSAAEALDTAADGRIVYGTSAGNIGVISDGLPMDLGHTLAEPITDLSCSYSGQCTVVGSKAFARYQSSDGTLVQFKCDNGPAHVASKDNPIAICGDRLWTARRGMRQSLALPSVGWSIGASRDGGLAAVGSLDGGVLVARFGATAREETFVSFFSAGFPAQLIASPDDFSATMLVAGGEVGTVASFDLNGPNLADSPSELSHWLKDYAKKNRALTTEGMAYDEED